MITPSSTPFNRELQSHTTAEADIRGGDDGLLISPVECTRDERTQNAVGRPSRPATVDSNRSRKKVMEPA